MAAFRALCLLLLAASLVNCQNSLSFLNGNYIMEWSHLEASNEIQFKVTAKTTGYVALGISNFNSAMKDIDVMFGTVVGGTPSVKDYWSASKQTPDLDSKQDFTLVSGSEANGETVLTFKRKLDTGDSSGQDIKIEIGSKYYIAVAFGSTDDLTWHTVANRAYSSKIELVPQAPSPTQSITPLSSMTTSSSPASTSEMPRPTPTTTVSPSSSAMPTRDNLFSFKDGSVSWNVDRNTNEISFTMKVKATGWLGLGITTENKDMKDMDIVVGGVFKNNTGYIGQYFSTTTGKPPKNEVNVQLVQSKEMNGETTVTFKRLLNTGDSKDIIIKPDTSYYLAWAYHKTSDDLTIHDERGYSSKMVLIKANNASSKTSSTISLVFMAFATVLLMM